MNNSDSRRPDTSIAYEGKHLHFCVDKTGWEYVHRPNSTEGVTIVAITPAKAIVLVEQYRIPISADVIELPAGLVGDVPGDTPLRAAKRELFEEVAYECDTMELVCKGSALPGLSDELNWLCVTRNARRANEGNTDSDPQLTKSKDTIRGKADEGEVIKRHEVPLAEVELWLTEQMRKGKIVDLKVYAGLYFARQEVPKTNRLFAAVDETEHVYTWDYSKKEAASKLIDVSDENFALITNCHDVDEETGAMGDYRSYNYKRCRVYSKKSLQEIEMFELDDKEDTIGQIEKKYRVSQLKETDVIEMKTGKLYISDGDLIIEE